jgi:hypothetical protein
VPNGQLVQPSSAPSLERAAPAVPLRSATLFDQALVALYLLGVYTNLGIYVGGRLLVPSVLCGIAGSLLLLKNLGRVREPHFVNLGAMIAISTITVLFSPNLLECFVEHAKSLAQLIYSLSLAYGFYLEVTRWPARQLRRLFLGASVAILAGLVMEVYTPFNRISDAVREVIYRDAFLYASEDRDLRDFGVLRPKLFTQEPSHPAKFLLASATAWLALSASPFRSIVYGGMILAGLYLTRSGMLLGAGVLGIAVLFFLPRPGGRPNERRITFIHYLAIPLGLALVATLGFLISPDRFKNSISDADTSTFMRFHGPATVVHDVLSAYPLFGAGVGGNEAVSNIILPIYIRHNSHAHYWFQNDPLGSFLGNAFFAYWVYLGLLGGAAFGVALVRLVRDLGQGYYWFSFLWIFVQLNLDGAFVGPRMWGYLFLGFALATVVDATTRRPQVLPWQRPESPPRF